MPLYRVPIYPCAALLLLGAMSFRVLRSQAPAVVMRIRRFWTIYAAFQVVLAGMVFGNHLSFPMNLEFMESTVLQHVARLSAGQPIYTDPSPGFVALAYNPLFYLLCVPFVRWLGLGMTSIRLPAVLASVGAGLMIFLLVRKRTGSRWWGGIAVGLFASAYRVMDCYLDVGHRDSMLLLAILGGFWCLDHGGKFQSFAGMVLLATGFWLKQPGALFLGMGLCYALWQYPWRSAIPASLVGLALGPVLYVLAPDSWWGPRLHYFTYEVPAKWTTFRWDELLNLMRLMTWHYGVLLAAAVWLWVNSFSLARMWSGLADPLGIWRIVLPGALLSGLAAMMSPGSNNNVYIPMGGVLIVVGVIALAHMSELDGQGRRVSYALLSLAFASLVYLPASVLRDSDPKLAYADLTRMLRTLDGPVYAPGLGPLFTPPGPEIYQRPLVHIVPMADMVRGPGRDEQSSRVVRRLLHSVESPPRVAYILSHSKLQDEATLVYLAARYRLETDFKNRFEPLATLPARHGHLYPRYLYRSISPPSEGTLAARGSSQ